MKRTMLCVVAIAALSGACKGPNSTPEQTAKTLKFPSIQVEPPRDGEILVIIPSGPVKKKGQLWFPQGTTLAAVLDMAGLNPVAPPRRVYVVETDGHAVRYQVAGTPRKELEQVRINHGTRIIVPYDRCFGFYLDEKKSPFTAT
jgi:hypothetical protein